MIKFKLNTVDVIGVISVTIVLIAAILWQIIKHDSPCLLCKLQRFGITLVGLCYLLNIIDQVKIKHYALGAIVAITTLLISSTQVLLHIAPGTGSYGEELFGLHFYTYSSLFLILIIVSNLLLIYFHEKLLSFKYNISRSLVIIYGITILLDIISILPT